MAIEIRGFHDWVIHEDIASAVDAYLDGTSTPAWRHRKVSRTTAASSEAASSTSEAADAQPEADVAAGEEDDQLEIVPMVASALPGDAQFEYCALAEGEALPEPGERQDVSVKFR